MSSLPWALNVLVALLSKQGQKALGFHQKYFHLCSKDERRSFVFWTDMRVSNSWQNFYFMVSYPFQIFIGRGIQPLVHEFSIHKQQHICHLFRLLVPLYVFLCAAQLNRKTFWHYFAFLVLLNHIQYNTKVKVKYDIYDPRPHNQS